MPFESGLTLLPARRPPMVAIAVLIGSLFLYLYSVVALQEMSRSSEKDLLSVVIPAPFQILLSGGDRFLAANTAVFRALVVGTSELDEKTYEILGQVQRDAALLNPAHEDNYYISQAILPWNGQLDSDLFVQEQATVARTWDALPAFFLGFDRFYFQKNPLEGAKAVQIAAERSPPGNREALTAMAARWSEKGDDPRVAISMIEALAANTRNEDLKKNLAGRKQRMEGLARLRDAAKLYTDKYGRAPSRLADLIGPGFLEKVPSDPLDEGYTLDPIGQPIIRKLSPQGRGPATLDGPSK